MRVSMVGSNYATWKVQARMTLLKDGLWQIVDGTETEPTDGDATPAAVAKFAGRRDKALATLVLSVDTSLLYLIANLDHPNSVWTKLSDQFCKKTWANKLELRRKLHSLRLKEGDSVQVHMKRMTEVFGQLAEIDSPLTEEDKVVYLLASLPDSFGVLVTALEASSEVPKMDMVSERLLHEERKVKFNRRTNYIHLILDQH